MSEEVRNETKEAMPFDGFVETVLQDYKLGWLSREASLLGRKEVLTGKAKFGIFGDGKELAQIAMAKVFQPGDFRSGYYRDQTFMMAIDALSVQQHFAALYAIPIWIRSRHRVVARWVGTSPHTCWIRMAIGYLLAN